MKRIVSLTFLSLVVLSAFNLVAFYSCFAAEWTVEVISAETGIIESGTWVPKNCFQKGETISFKVGVINRAIVSKDANITVTVFDSTDQPIGYNDKEVTLRPETTKTIYIPITIPRWVATGEAAASINALQVIEGLPLCPPYCPETNINLAIKGCISRTIVGQGYTTDVDVHVTNVYATESITFDLLVYYDDHDEVCDVIGKVNDTILEVGESESFMFAWNTIGVPYGIYYIYAWMYFDYPELENELLENATVAVTTPGDVNADFRVDTRDIYLIVSHFGCQEGSPGYLANCDINGDHIIDMIEISIAIAHFGEKAP